MKLFKKKPKFKEFTKEDILTKNDSVFKFKKGQMVFCADLDPIAPSIIRGIIEKRQLMIIDCYNDNDISTLSKKEEYMIGGEWWESEFIFDNVEESKIFLKTGRRTDSEDTIKVEDARDIRANSDAYLVGE